MKHIIISIFLLACVAFCSCNKDFLDKQPLDQIPAELYYSDQQQVDAALVGCYYRIMFGYWDGNIGSNMNVCSSNAIFDCFADNGNIKWGFLGITSGNLNPSNTATVTIYPYVYGSIAIFNDFIANMESPKTNFLDGALRKQYIAEAKFLRAYEYFFLTNLYGDVPLTLTPQGAKYFPSKAPKQVVLDSVARDLDYGIANLPNKAYEGKVVRGAAYALKMKVMLYQKRYDEVIKIWNSYFAAGENKFSIAPHFYDVFKGNAQKNCPEIIFSGIYAADDRYRNDIDVTLTAYADAVALPDLMNAYEFNDGTSFSTSSPKFDRLNAFNNRDPRLRMTIFDTVDVKTPGNFYYGKLASGKPDGKLIIKKFAMDEMLPASWTQIGSEQDAVLLRFGDVALMYAEAENELNGPSDKVINAVQMVRGRPDVNMPPLPSGLTQDQLRTRIRNERRVELAFEGGQRYFDLMRWKLMGSIIPNIVDPNGVRRQWNENNYLWPFPTNALNANPNLVQNPGYPRL